MLGRVHCLNPPRPLSGTVALRRCSHTLDTERLSLSENSRSCAPLEEKGHKEAVIKKKQEDPVALQGRRREYDRRYNLQHQEERRAYHKLYRRENQERIKQHKRLYERRNEERNRGKRREYLRLYEKGYKDKRREYYRANRGRIAESNARYREGSGLKTRFGSLCKALQFAFPEQNWDPKKFSFRGKKSSQRWLQVNLTRILPETTKISEASG